MYPFGNLDFETVKRSPDQQLPDNRFKSDLHRTVSRLRMSTRPIHGEAKLRVRLSSNQPTLTCAEYNLFAANKALVLDSLTIRHVYTFRRLTTISFKVFKPNGETLKVITVNGTFDETELRRLRTSETLKRQHGTRQSHGQID